MCLPPTPYHETGASDDMLDSLSNLLLPCSVPTVVTFVLEVLPTTTPPTQPISSYLNPNIDDPQGSSEIWQNDTILGNLTQRDLQRLASDWKAGNISDWPSKPLKDYEIARCLHPHAWRIGQALVDGASAAEQRSGQLRLDKERTFLVQVVRPGPMTTLLTKDFKDNVLHNGDSYVPAETIKSSYERLTKLAGRTSFDLPCLRFALMDHRGCTVYHDPTRPSNNSLSESNSTPDDWGQTRSAQDNEPPMALFNKSTARSVGPSAATTLLRAARDYRQNVSHRDDLRVDWHAFEGQSIAHDNDAVPICGAAETGWTPQAPSPSQLEDRQSWRTSGSDLATQNDTGEAGRLGSAANDNATLESGSSTPLLFEDWLPPADTTAGRPQTARDDAPLILCPFASAQPAAPLVSDNAGPEDGGWSIGSSGGRYPRITSEEPVPADVSGENNEQDSGEGWRSPSPDALSRHRLDPVVNGSMIDRHCLEPSRLRSNEDSHHQSGVTDEETAQSPESDTSSSLFDSSQEMTWDDSMGAWVQQPLM